MAKTPSDQNDHDYITEDGDALWDYVARTISPLHRDRLRQVVTVQRVGALAPMTSAAAPAPRKPVPASSLNPGIDRRTEDRFRRGQMVIEATIDLHGLTSARAHPALERFILGAHAQGMRCILVITGKGGQRAGRHEDGQAASGVLRRSLPEWLSMPALSPLILRATAAKPKHGGSGAFYILLRRRRDRAD